MASVAGDDSDSPPTASTRASVEEDPSRNPGVSSVLQRWRRENFLERSVLSLRGACLFFSLISLSVMGSNNHGDGRKFGEYQEYRYCLGIAILAFLYTMAQVAYQVYRLNNEKELLTKRTWGILDFAGDQVVAYLLMSAVSAAIPITNRIREGADNLFTDSSSASIGMAFLAYLSLALSALISGYKLCTKTYI